MLARHNRRSAIVARMTPATWFAIAALCKVCMALQWLWPTLKPFAGPAALFLVGLGFEVSTIQSNWLAALFFGIAITWGAASLLSNRAMLRRWPWLLEWMPFLDPTGGFAAAEQLTGSFIKGQHFRIAMLAHEGMIYDRVFEDCVLYGPAVLIFSEYADAKDCIFACPSPDKLHWELKFEKDKTLIADAPVGAIIIRQCIFKRCTFIGIGFVGNAESIAAFKLPAQGAMPTQPPASCIQVSPPPAST